MVFEDEGEGVTLRSELWAISGSAWWTGRGRWGSEGLPFKSGSLTALVMGGIVKVMSHFHFKAKILAPYLSTLP